MENFSEPIELLVIDENHEVVQAIKACFPHPRYHCVTATRAILALGVLPESQFHVVLCSTHLPSMDALRVLRGVLATNPQAIFLLLSDSLDPMLEAEAMKMGAYDCIRKPFTCEELIAHVERALEMQLSAVEQEIFQTLVEQALQDRTAHLHKALQRVGGVQTPGLEMLVAALDAREHQSNFHSLRVQQFTRILADKCGYEPTFIKDLGYGALLHDIGKIAIPDAMLLKPDRLTSQEVQIVQHHCIFGFQVLSRIPRLQQAATVALFHHERIDGAGYPMHLKGNDIPLQARIFAVADTLDVMTEGRPYRALSSMAEVRKEIVRCRGSQFDKDVVDVFMTIPDEEWRAAREEVERRYKNMFDRMMESFRGRKFIQS